MARSRTSKFDAPHAVTDELPSGVVYYWQNRS